MFESLVNFFKRHRHRHRRGVTGVNPVPGWVPSRIDQGVDGTLSASGFVAPWQCKVLVAIQFTPGWKGGWTVVEFLEGPLTGVGIYIAEGAVPVVSVGQVVPAGGRLCNRSINGFNNILGNIEAGFVAANQGESLARTLPGYSGDQSLQAITCGSAFNVMLERLGAVPGHNDTSLTPDWSLLPTEIRNYVETTPVQHVFPLKVGSTGPKVKQLQYALRARQIWVTVDGNFGPLTETAVKDWQKSVGHNQTGVVNRTDWDFMFPALSVQSGNGWPGATKALQHELDDHGYSLTQDGNFGPMTEGAVKQFQRQHGLTADGICGHATWAKLASS